MEQEEEKWRQIVDDKDAELQQTRSALSQAQVERQADLVRWEIVFCSLHVVTSIVWSFSFLTKSPIGEFGFGIDCIIVITEVCFITILIYWSCSPVVNNDDDSGKNCMIWYALICTCLVSSVPYSTDHRYWSHMVILNNDEWALFLSQPYFPNFKSIWISSLEYFSYLWDGEMVDLLTVWRQTTPQWVETKKSTHPIPRQNIFPISSGAIEFASERACERMSAVLCMSKTMSCLHAFFYFCMRNSFCIWAFSSFENLIPFHYFVYDKMFVVWARFVGMNQIDN